MDLGLYSDKPGELSFESHLSSLEQGPKRLLLEIRDFVKSLGSNVIEEVRPHRIVYAKSLTFRTFLDIQLRNNALVVSLRKSRTEPVLIKTIDSSAKLNDFKKQIEDAYISIK
ncbi:MAG TPA: hypothetical protein VH500_05180 [Nitrososphaeraceae archaeon]|jgi:hypothetical protein